MLFYLDLDMSMRETSLKTYFASKDTRKMAEYKYGGIVIHTRSVDTHKPVFKSIFYYGKRVSRGF